MPLENAGAIDRLPERLPAMGILFRETGSDYDYDRHPIFITLGAP